MAQGYREGFDEIAEVGARLKVDPQVEDLVIKSAAESLIFATESHDDQMACLLRNPELLRQEKRETYTEEQQKTLLGLASEILHAYRDDDIIINCTAGYLNILKTEFTEFVAQAGNPIITDLALGVIASQTTNNEAKALVQLRLLKNNPKVVRTEQQDQLLNLLATEIANNTLDNEHTPIVPTMATQVLAYEMSGNALEAMAALLVAVNFTVKDFYALYRLAKTCLGTEEEDKAKGMLLSAYERIKRSGAVMATYMQHPEADQLVGLDVRLETLRILGMSSERNEALQQEIASLRSIMTSPSFSRDTIPVDQLVIIIKDLQAARASNSLSNSVWNLYHELLRNDYGNSGLSRTTGIVTLNCAYYHYDNALSGVKEFKDSIIALDDDQYRAIENRCIFVSDLPQDFRQDYKDALQSCADVIFAHYKKKIKMTDVKQKTKVKVENILGGDIRNGLKSQFAQALHTVLQIDNIDHE